MNQPTLSTFLLSGLLALCLCQSTAAADGAIPPTGGSAAELERKTFGDFLVAGKTPPRKSDGIQGFMLAFIQASYNITGQYAQVLRLCTYQESIAPNVEETRRARQCRLTALINLERYAEAEELLYADAAWERTPTLNTPLEQLSHLSMMIRICLNQGNLALASESADRQLTLMTQAKKRQTYPEGVDLKVIASIEELRLSMVDDIEIQAHQLKTDVAYYEQNSAEFAKRFQTLLALPGMDRTNERSETALANASKLIRLNHYADAVANARKYLQNAEASAGFRDVPKPLVRFDVLKAVSDVLGDERTHRGHVTSWLRLAIAYSLLDRDQEATRLLEATKKLAVRYEMEEPAASSLMASVEEVEAEFALKHGDRSSAIAALRSARQRYLRGGIAERSSVIGRRSLPFGSPLLNVNAKLLALIAATESSPIRDQRIRQEVMEIADDFSASRADSSARQAAHAMGVADSDIGATLRQEGILVDELIELRGRLSEATRNPEAQQQERLIIQARIHAIMDELRVLKKALEKKSNAPSPQAVLDSTLQMPGNSVYWQWVLHPEGNTIIAIMANGIWLAPMGATLPSVRGATDALRLALTPTAEWKLERIPPYPTEPAKLLYQALFRPISDHLPPSSYWVVSPPPSLDRLPWAALIPSPERQTAAKPWLADRVAIAVAPSLSSWVQLQARPRSAAKRQFLGIGDPLIRGPITLRSLGVRGSYLADISVQASVQLPERSSFARELSQAASLFARHDTLLLVQQAATKRAVLSTPLSEFRVILFSTHGLINPGISHAVGPGLLLSGSTPRERILTSGEIAHLRLDSELVVLNACDTGASDGFAATEGFSGLTSSFLLAGARTVVATLWPVETVSTGTTMVDALAEYSRAQGDAFAFALQKAMLKKAHGKQKQFRHPYFWAGFVAVGR